MSAGKQHHIWIEQCEASRTIRERFGLEAAFDYAVGEKLMNFASAAHDHPQPPGPGISDTIGSIAVTGVPAAAAIRYALPERRKEHQP